MPEKAPKRAMSAYHFYAAEKRAGVKNSASDLTSSEIVKKLTDDWRDLSPEAREKYVDLANEDKKRYERDSVGYVPPPKPTKSGKRLAKDAEAPKKAKTAYLFFADDKRPELSRQHPGLGVSGLAKPLADAWKVCSERERKKFESLAEKDKARYDKEMETYTPSEAYLKAKEDFKNKKKTGVDVSLELPGSLFDSEEMETLKEETKKLTKQIADLTKQTSKQAAIIEKLTEKLEKKVAKEKEKKERKAGKATPKPKRTEKEEEAEEPVPESFDEFTMRVWGENGAAATPKMKRILANKGKDALIQFLADQYAKENDSSTPVSGKKRKEAEPASSHDEAPKKRGRPKGSKNKPKET